MGIEEEIEEFEDDACEEIVEEELTSGEEFMNRRLARYRAQDRKRKALVSRFLGKKKTVDASVIQPRYYGELLTWALHRYIELEGWKLTRTVGFYYPKPVYIDVNTGPEKQQDLLRNGTMIVEMGGDRLAVMVDINMERSNSIVITGPADRKERIEKFAEDVKSIMKSENFYRGRMIELRGRIRFPDLPKKTWDDLVLDEATKNDIWANTIGFLSNRERLKEYGIPTKRGVLLVGEPGTGKTLTCKALMAKAEGFTCIIASVDALEIPPYIYELYELAQDTSPSMVLIEDIDLIAQEREEFGYHRGSSLLVLLSVLDGVEECDGVVTIATTNCQDTLDKAIAKRPSRFDRIIQYPKPALEERKELVKLLCHKVPLDDDVRGYVALKTENFTPAQIQEVVFTLAIGYCQQNDGEKPEILTFSTEEVESAITKVSKRTGRSIGFTIPDTRNGECVRHSIPLNNERERRESNG